MHFDALLLSRLQFAFTIAFHIIFPSFTIGLASFLAVLEGLWLATRNEAFKVLYLFWVKIFAISFGMGVVTGVVMSYEIGTNWSVYSAAAAPVIGPPLAFQPAKLAAIEAFWDTRAGQPFHIVAWPDRAAEANRWELSIPRLGSLITAGNADAEVKGLKAFAPEDRPPVFVVFWAFRVMV